VQARDVRLGLPDEGFDRRRRRLGEHVRQRTADRRGPVLRRSVSARVGRDAVLSVYKEQADEGVARSRPDDHLCRDATQLDFVSRQTIAEFRLPMDRYATCTEQIY